MNLYLLIIGMVFLQLPAGAPTARAPVERLGPNLFKVGTLQIDTVKREVSATATLNDVSVLEFLANSKGSIKAYESALTVDTDAISFNVALVLIGLNPLKGKGSSQHFDPAPVSGDPVSITVEWTTLSGGAERGPIERLLMNKETGEGIAPGDWVYTGSTFDADGRYAAETEGILIGFAHRPESIIESVKGIGLGRYGTIVVNRNDGPPPLAPITLRVTALARPEPVRGER